MTHIIGPYKYHYRPGYGSEKLLLEFLSGVEDESFISDLFSAIKSIQPEIMGNENIWMDDTFTYTMHSTIGNFILSKDIWNFAFMHADYNQDCLDTINQLLLEDVRFKKIEVDFNDYKVISPE
jgi:hypothetical protein